MKKIGVGLVGSGFMGRSHAHAFRERRRVGQVCAIQRQGEEPVVGQLVDQHAGQQSQPHRSDGEPRTAHLPVGRSIGPALEMGDVLAILRGEPAAPDDLRSRALLLAGALLELGGAAAAGQGRALARETLDSGAALRKFERICIAQGGFREPVRARRQHVMTAGRSGVVRRIDNRKISRLAKLAGAPDWPAAGLELHVRLGDSVAAGQPVVTLHADSETELSYPLAYAAANRMPQAITELQKSLLAVEHYDHPLTCMALLALGRIAFDEGKYEAAITYCHEATISGA